MASGDFVLVMSFIGEQVRNFFNILQSVYFGDYSLFTIFASILVLRIVIWFIGRLLGVHIDTTLENTSERFSTRVGAFFSNNYQRYHTFRHKNKMKLENKHFPYRRRNTIKWSDYRDMHRRNR